MTDDEHAPRILVAEDMLLVAMEVEEVLRDCGCEPVGPVARADQVAAIARTEPLDAAVLDVNLGGSMVFDAANELADRGVPTLFVTGYDERTFPERFRGAPRLAKPFLRHQLEAEVKCLLRRSGAAAP